MTNELGTALIAECKRRMFDESQARVNACLDRLSEAQVWQRPNAVSNSVGNLVLHLCGNIHQWVHHGLGGAADQRQRDREYEHAGPMPTDQLRLGFNQTLDEARRVIESLDPGGLLEPKPVQGFDETALSILIHVTEHLSYHTGQIVYITKALTGEQTGFYDGIDLNTGG